jgi:hypothetical protein
MKIWNKDHPAKVARPQADEVNMLWGICVLIALRNESKEEFLAAVDADPTRPRQ